MHHLGPYGPGTTRGVMWLCLWYPRSAVLLFQFFQPFKQFLSSGVGRYLPLQQL